MRSDAGEVVLAQWRCALRRRQSVSLEESPHFNAGKGSVFDADGKHELDASIMDGAPACAPARSPASPTCAIPSCSRAG